MGYDGVSKFKNTLNYMKNGQWELASKEMLDSKWAIQTPDRATKLSKYPLAIHDLIICFPNDLNLLT